MYVSISQEISRQHRQEIMREVRAVRTNGERKSSLARDLGWELSRYAGLFAKRFRR